MPITDQNLITMDSDIKSLQGEVGRLVHSQEKQTDAISRSVEMMGRLCERLDSSIESSARAHSRLDKIEVLIYKNKDDITDLRARQPTKEAMIGYVVMGIIAVGGAVAAIAKMVV